MKRQLPPYVYPLKGVLYFQRRGWPTVRFENQQIGDAFYAEYALILRGTPPAPKGRTLKALIDSYQRSPKFAEKKPRTRADYVKYMGKLEKAIGSADVTRIRRVDVIRLRDQNADRHRHANYLVQCIRLLLEHAIDKGWIDQNHAKGVSMLKSPYDSRKPWPVDKLAAFRAAYPYGTRERLLLELCLGTGQRIGDVLKMRWADIAGDGISISQNKTDKALFLPLTDSLREALQHAKRRNLTILTNYQGNGPWSYRGASDAFRNAREAIGALDYDLHSLRYTTATELALAGCTDELIAAVTGQSPAMVAKYTATVRQKVRAVEAQRKRK